MSVSNVTLTQNNAEIKKSGYSFYIKLLFLYFLNLVDWVCTEALIASGRFYEANPLMKPVLTEFMPTLLIKGALPLALVIICALLFKFSGIEENKWTNILLYVGITAYSIVNLYHIFNFVLLFSLF